MEAGQSRGRGDPACRRRPSQLLSPDEEQIKTIYSALTISDLWKRLGDGREVEEIRLGLDAAERVSETLPEVGNGERAVDRLDFTPAHSKILNTMVRNNPLLMSGSFAVLVRNSSTINGSRTVER
jgi:E3 ubiquitin-protein ligase HUWE1